MKMKNFLIMLLVVVVVGAALGGTFFWGEAVGKTKGEAVGLEKGELAGIEKGKEEAKVAAQEQLAQYYANYQNRGTDGATGLPGQGLAARRNAAYGQVVAVSGNTITYTNQTGKEVTVNVSSDTAVNKAVQGSAKDISVGETIMVTGTAQSDGSIVATSISIIPATMLGTPAASP